MISSLDQAWCDDVNENYCVAIMQSSVVIVIESWCCGPAALIKGIKIQSLLAEGVGCEKGNQVISLFWLMKKKEQKEKEDQKINCTKKAMEPVEIESKRTNVGSNIKTYNGQKLMMDS